jgi:hypothetical protein
LTNGGRRARLDEIQRIAEAFREPVETPDFSSSILARVDSQRCFLSSQGRALVWAGRGAAALTIVLVVLGFTLAARHAPETVQAIAAQPAPVSGVISTVSTQASEQLTALKFSLEPNVGGGTPITSILQTVAPSSDIAQPIAAAFQAVKFVGPPEVSADEPGFAVWFSSDLQPSRAARSAWPQAGLRDAMDDRRWLEDESPLLSGAGAGGPLSPK